MEIEHRINLEPSWARPKLFCLPPEASRSHLGRLLGRGSRAGGAQGAPASLWTKDGAPRALRPRCGRRMAPAGNQRASLNRQGQCLSDLP